VGKVCGKKKLCRRYPKEKVDKCKKKRGVHSIDFWKKYTNLP
jgi:hypothetical protein